MIRLVYGNFFFLAMKANRRCLMNQDRHRKKKEKKTGGGSGVISWSSAPGSLNV